MNWKNSNIEKKVSLALLDILGKGLFILDKKGAVLHVNESFSRLTGYNNSDIKGRLLAEIIHSNGPAPVIDHHCDMPEKIECFDIGIVTKTSAIIDAQVCLFSLADETSYVRAGTIEKRSEVPDPGIEDKTRIFTMAVEQSPATVVLTDVDGRILYVNPKFSKLTGYSYDEAIGQNPRILKSGVQPDRFYRQMWETISTGKEWRGEFHNIKKNGESYWESASISPIINAVGEITHYLAVKEDITERKTAQEALRVSEEILRKKNRAMEQELQYAQLIIKRLLPEKVPQPRELRIGYRYIPLDAIGGDFFSFNPRDTGLGVFIGDVAGHGVSAALFLSLVKAVTDRLNDDSGSSPGNYINELNRELQKNLTASFITAIYGYFDFSQPGVTFRYSRAGHPPPILITGEGSVRLLVSAGKPIGIFENVQTVEERVDLKQGDRLFLYTDGIQETINEEKLMLDYEGMIEIIKTSRHLPLDEALEYILAGVDSFRGNSPREDDLILLGFEVV